MLWSGDLPLQTKDKLRVLAEKKRTAALKRMTADQAGCWALSHLLGTGLISSANSAIAAYWPLRTEIDPRGVMLHIHEQGGKVALPVMQGPDQPLIFRAWMPDMRLEAADHGVMVPRATSPSVIPSLLLVPLLAFDREGYRLGYGGGYYDRTIKSLRMQAKKEGRLMLAVGFAFSDQEVDHIPHEAHDEKLDYVATEKEVRRFRLDDF